MLDETSASDRRLFGRRAVSVEATAVLPGGIEVPCLIENVSDGGVMLNFPTGVAPTQSFQLSVGVVGRSLLCEIRHRRGSRMGVRFISLVEGIALNRELQRPMVMPAPVDAPVRRASEVKPMARCSVRELRRAVLGIDVAPPAGVQPPVVPVSAEPVEAPADGEALVLAEVTRPADGGAAVAADAARHAA